MKALVTALFVAVVSIASNSNAASLPKTINVVPVSRSATVDRAEEVRDAFAAFPLTEVEEGTVTNAEFIHGEKFYRLAYWVGEGSEIIEMKIEIDGFLYEVNGEIGSIADKFWLGDSDVTDQAMKDRLAREFVQAIDALIDFSKTNNS